MRNNIRDKTAQYWMVNMDSINGKNYYYWLLWLFLFYFNYYYFWLHEMWDLSSPTRDENQATCFGNTEF